MTFDEFVGLASSEARWEGVTKLPWGEPLFSERMLREHLSQRHDGASRRLELIERHVSWIHNVVLEGQRQRILDLGCGPGLYTQRLASFGHECVGIDIGPAAIAYARAQVADGMPRPRYILGDFTAARFEESFDVAMMIHGEFNTLTREQAAGLVRRIAIALAPGGGLLLEVHPLGAVEGMGRRGRVWYAVQSGLFGDRPHLRMDESRWNAETAQAVNLNWVMDGEMFSVERFGTVTQGYSDEEYVRLLADAGFSRHERYPSLTGEAPETDYAVLLASM